MADAEQAEYNAAHAEAEAQQAEADDAQAEAELAEAEADASLEEAANKPVDDTVEAALRDLLGIGGE